MSRIARLLAVTLLALAATIASACDEGGIGISVPASGARWGGTGPDVLVGGGPR